MNAAFLRKGFARGILPTLTLLLVATAISTHADQIDMKNGDRYSGKVASLETNTVVLNSELLGTLRIRRDNIASISFGAAPASAPVAAPAPDTAPSAVPKAPPVPVVSSATGPNPQIDLNTSLMQQIAANPQLVKEVQDQVLAGAGPEALKKYNSLISGLSTGSINIGDLQREAASVAAQLRQNRGSGDDESGAIFDEYLTILDSFAAETQATLPSSSTAKPTVSPK